MKLKSFAIGAVLAAASFAASASTIISTPILGTSFDHFKIGTITVGGLSDLTGSVFAFDTISAGPWNFTLDTVTFTSATVGSLVDLDSSAAGFSFKNVTAGSYDVYATGWLAHDGQYHDLAALGAHYEVTAVPEPETYAMLLGGLGLVGAIARRKAKKAA